MVVGAGETTLLGTVVDEQSHCVRADGTFFAGRFTLTNARGRRGRGLYFGRLEPTFDSTFPPPAPGGPWLMKGHVSHSRWGRGRARQRPVRGTSRRSITNLSTGDATIFLDPTIDVD